MNFLSPHKRPRRGYLRVLAALGSAAAVFFALQWFAPHVFAPLAARIAFPIFSAEAALGAFFSGASGWFYSHAALSADRASLQEKVAVLETDNEFLKALTLAGGSGAQSAPQTAGKIVAAVLARPRWSAYDTLTIDRGADNGVAPGMQVFSGSFAIGEIAETIGRTALVSLYSTAGKRTLAQIAEKFPVELIGAGGGAFETEVPPETPIQNGDGAFAPSVSPTLFAVVGAIEQASEGIVKVYLHLPVNIFELHTVEIEL